jgi:hypothetical protein
MPLGALCDHHRIAKLYEIFTLHGQQLLASFIDLRFGRKFDNQQVSLGDRIDRRGCRYCRKSPNAAN